MLKVRRSAVRHSVVDSWWVETASNQTFQLFLAVLVKFYLILANLQNQHYGVA